MTSTRQCPNCGSENLALMRTLDLKYCCCGQWMPWRLANIDANMVRIPAGTFLMGSPEDELERVEEEGPQQLVTIPDFEMARFPVTFSQWDAIMGDTYRPDDEGRGRGDRPVINVSFDDAIAFIERLNAMTGDVYRLPSESEWEHACRAGTTSRFNTGETITTDQANFDGHVPAKGCPKGEYRQKTLPVGSFAPNAFGLHDMHGNVWEWCEDTYVDSLEDIPLDGSPRLDGDPRRRVLRGGSCFNFGRFLRSAYRNYSVRDFRLTNGGFRLSRSVVMAGNV